MKRYVDYFRIKVILVIAIIVLPFVFWITVFNVMSPDYGGSEVSITFKNAPENTAYVDILVKLPEDSEDYIDFAEWENPPGINQIGKKKVAGSIPMPVFEKEILITPDSEIAKLNADGYVSLSVHYAYSEGFHGTGLDLSVHGKDIAQIKDSYGKFKAAYVDENGNVLGITNLSRTRHNPKEASSFSANGNNLVYTEWSLSPHHYIMLYGSFFGETAAIIALIVIIIIQSVQKPKPSLPPRPECNPRSIEERNKDSSE